MKQLGLMMVVAAGSLGALGACGEDTSCFVAGTRVLTPEGWRLVEDLAPEDEVWSFDVTRREPVVRRVVRVMRSVAPAIARMEAGELAVRGVTGSHPFWDAARSEFVRFDALSLASRLLAWFGSGEAHEVEVTAIARVRARTEAEVFNLEVEGPEHNYFAEGILVHNKSTGCPNDDCQGSAAQGGGGEGGSGSAGEGGEGQGGEGGGTGGAGDGGAAGAGGT